MVGAYGLGAFGMWLILRWLGLDGNDRERRRERHKHYDRTKD